MKRRSILIIAFLVLLLAVSFFTPSLILGLRDRRLYAEAEAVSVDPVQLSLISDLSPLERLQTAASGSSTSIVLTGGRVFTTETARVAADSVVRELELVVSDPEDYDVTIAPELRLTSDGGAIVLWNVGYYSDSLDVELVLDDEYGWCLGYRRTFYPYGKEYYMQESAEAPPPDESAEHSLTDGAVTGVYTDGKGNIKEYTVEREAIFEAFFAGRLETVTRLLDPMGVYIDSVFEESEGVYSAYVIDYENSEEYYLLPVTVRSENNSLGYIVMAETWVNMPQ